MPVTSDSHIHGAQRPEHLPTSLLVGFHGLLRQRKACDQFVLLLLLTTLDICAEREEIFDHPLSTRSWPAADPTLHNHEPRNVIGAYVGRTIGFDTDVVTQSGKKSPMIRGGVQRLVRPPSPVVAV